MPFHLLLLSLPAFLDLTPRSVLRSPAGRRQSQPTGVGYRTGPPGKHVGPEKSQFLIDDERVRVFVGPAFKADGSAEFAFDKVRFLSLPSSCFPFVFERILWVARRCLVELLGRGEGRVQLK